MKPEQTERLFVEQLFKEYVEKKLKSPSPESAQVTKLTGDASTRRYYRINNGEKQSYVLCLDNPQEIENEDYEFFSIQRFFESNKIRVPKIYDLDIKKGFVLQEDLGDQTLLSHLSSINGSTDELKLYKQAIDILLRLQVLTQKKEQSPEIANRAFNVEKYLFEFGHCHKYFIKNLLGAGLSQDEEKIFFDHYESVSMSLSRLPRVITHRDFHSRNIMFWDKELVVIDFQDARMGTHFYDLVSLLEDCYYQIGRENKEKLVDYYCDHVDRSIIYPDFFKSFERNYKMMKIQRLYKAIGSFAYIFCERKDSRYLRYIGRSMEELKTALMSFKEFDDFRKTLFKIYYES